MDANTTIVYRGFFNLPALEKLELVNSINDYFDSNDREPIRAANAAAFEEVLAGKTDTVCPCCGR